MYLMRYGRDFSRRVFLVHSARGMFRAGVLCSAWTAFLRTGDANAAYPDELKSIEVYTHGRLKPGDTVTKDNVHLVKDLLDPVRYFQIAEMGRRIVLQSTTGDLSKLNPVSYIEATLANRGQARFDQKGNIVTAAGLPWIGGNPFMEPRTGTEVFAAHTLSWGRHDASVYVSKEYDLDEAGRVQYEYASVWAEMAATGRIVMAPRPYMPGREDKLRYQSVLFVDPGDIKGTSYLNIWPYDQTRFPELFGYLPAFKRVRRFPTNQRFEPLTPGSELYLSDAWAAGDPFLTWGDYKVVHRGPFLGAVSRGWNSAHPNWEHSTHGGADGKLFWDMNVELVPEAIVVEAVPTGYPRAPVTKKRVWFDARTLVPLAMISYDRRGQMFRFFDGAYSSYEDQTGTVRDGKEAYWSWSHLHAFNVQTKRLTRIEQVKEIAGGHIMRVNDPSTFDRYLTVEAMQRNGK